LLFLYNASIIRLYQILGCLKFFHINDEKRLYLLARTIKKHYFCGMKMITILGPTASGKTDIAAHLAYELGAEIISADSRQVYRGMDIGTGKDLEDYIVNGTPVPYHLIDICDAGAKYNLFQYQEDFLKAYDDITSRGVQPILCGGTGLYIESVLKGYHLSPVPQNPELRASLEGKSLEELTVMLKELKAKAGSNMHNKTDVDSCQRAIRAIEIESYNLENPIPVRDFPAIDSIIIGVNIDRDERRRKITNRLRKRLDDGMVDEIKQLLASGIPAEDLIYYGLEYKYITEYVIGKTSYDDMFRGLEIAIHQFAKRQMTWFRGMERRGFKIHWIDAMLPMDEKVKAIKKLIK
jgi:tRNA dimethylallyltransferase